MTPIRVAVLCDYREEQWPSMDLVGEKLIEHLNADCQGEVEAIRVCPPFRIRAGAIPVAGRRRVALNIDRLINRYHEYPRVVRGLVRQGGFDIYHLADHSYGQLLHEIPVGRGVVNCHDLDTFRCLLDPEAEPRPAWFRRLTRRSLDGFARAAYVSCNTDQTRHQVLSHSILPPDRVETISLGLHAECRPESDAVADAEVGRLIGPRDLHEGPVLLHVGSNIPRKRIDLLLRIFAGVRGRIPSARLLKVGRGFDGEHAALADQLDLNRSIIVAPFAETRTLAAFYRRADLLLQPSEAEGFGLPVAECLACGTTVLASDLDALREVGGDGAVYRPVGDVPAWVEAATTMLREKAADSASARIRREAGLRHVRRFSWTAHARRLSVIYRGILQATSGSSGWNPS